MKTIINGQEIKDGKGQRYFRITPKDGIVNVYGMLPDGTYGSNATYTFDSATPLADLRFYLPMIPGDGWKFEITGNAIAEYH